MTKNSQKTQALSEEGKSQPAKVKAPKVGIFEIGSAFVTILVAPYVNQAMKTNAFILSHQKETGQFSESNFPHFEDLWVSIASFIAIHALKKLLVIVLWPVVQLIRRSKENESDE